MRKLKSLLAASLLGISGLVSAVPLIKVDVSGELPLGPSLNFVPFDVLSNEVGLYNVLFEAAPRPGTQLAGSVYYGVGKDSGGGFSLVDFRSGVGSFTFHAAQGAYKAFVLGLNLSSDTIPAHLQVASVPEPETWGMLLLGAGFVAFQVRRRKNG